MGAPHAHTGATIASRYRLERRIAVGGMGEVWFATDLSLGRDVAVKLLLPGHAQDEVTRLRFQAEAKAAASIPHAGIVPVFDFGEEVDESGGHVAFLVMEYVDGESLAKVLEKFGPLSPERTLEILAQTAAALEAAHSTGLVHRDIKPANLLVDAEGNVKVTDFGIARSTDMTPLTRTGTIVGTPQYISPEQAKGESATPASDLYSLGVVAYACLTGRTPFSDAGNEISTAMAHIQVEPPPLPDDVPPHVAQLVLALLAKDPLDRPASAAAVARAAAGLREDPDLTIEIAPPRPDSKAVSRTGAAGVAAKDPTGGGAKTRARHYGTFAAVLVVALLGLGAVLIQGAASESVKVPNLVGKDIAAARALLIDAGLTVEERSLDVPGAVPGSVDAQHPLPSAEVESGSTVVLTVVSGQVTVPTGLDGATYDEAAKLLAAAGLRASKATQTTEARPPGTVIAVTPTGRVAEGTTVVLTVAAEPVTIREEVLVPAEQDEPTGSGPSEKATPPGKSNPPGKGKGEDKGKGNGASPLVELLDLLGPGA